MGVLTEKCLYNFMVFVGRLIHEIKNPTNNETWEAV
jgi:hypothetical protein